MKRLQFFLCLLLLSESLLAVSAYRLPFNVPQPDGSTLTVRLFGDEHFHYYATMDTIPVMEDENGYFYYAMIDNDRMVKSPFLAHAYENRNTKERNTCRRYAEDVCNYIRATVAIESNENRSILKRTKRVNEHGGISRLEGNRKVLVILVDFANLSMTEPDAGQCFFDRFNKVGYDENNHIGSVHDYFYAQSYGALDLSFDVVGPVTLSRNFGYYGKNLDNATDINVREMVVEACKSVDNKVNFSDYDWDGDGEIEQIYLIYAGYGESYGAPSNTIWPHKSELYKSAIELDGVKINTYACSCELSGRYGNNINGIGTICHEFSHCLGLPDFYDTGNGYGVGMDYWDVMCSGSYSGKTGCGEVPCGYSAYERWFFGWLDFKELTDICRIKDMPCIGERPVAYAIYNDNNRDECLLLENRQNTDWFSFVHESEDCHGLFVAHVDYAEEAWKNNSVNADKDRQRMTFIPADKDITGKKPEGTLFPGINGVNEITNDSHKNCGGRWNTVNKQGTNDLNAPITNICEENGFISFDFKGGLFVETPTLHEAENITENSFEIKWDLANDADTYTIEIMEERQYVSLVDSVINPRFHLIIDNLVGDRYCFQSLKTTKYRFRIKAIRDGASSSWSDYGYVDLSSASIVENVYECDDKDGVWYNLKGIKDNNDFGIKISPVKGKVFFNKRNAH